MYSSYGEALDAYLGKEYGRGGKKKLAKMLADDPSDNKKVHSQQVNIGRWTNSDPEKRKEPQNYAKKEIHKSLNICIEELPDGKWKIKRTNKEKPLDEQPDSSEIDELTNQALQLARLLKSDKSAEPELDDRIRGLELAELMIRLVKESLKKESSD